MISPKQCNHEIYKSFDDGLEVRGVFLDIFKAFVWHEVKLRKLSLNGISGNLFKRLGHFLQDFLQLQVCLVCLDSSRLYFRITVFNLHERFIVFLNCKRFAEDVSLFSVVNDIQSIATTLRNNLTVISNWALQWKMIFNPDLTKILLEVIFSRKTKKLIHSSLPFNNVSL